MPGPSRRLGKKLAYLIFKTNYCRHFLERFFSPGKNIQQIEA
jgi:hypothetical protein